MRSVLLQSEETTEDPLVVLAEAALASNAEGFDLPVAIDSDPVPLPFDAKHTAQVATETKCNVCSS